MLITRLARSFGILQRREVAMLTIELGQYFSPLLSKHANIVMDNGFGNYSITNDYPRNQPGRWVKQQTCDADDDEPPVIPTEDELPMNLYNVALRRYHDNLGGGVNYIDLHLYILMQDMSLQRPSEFPVHILISFHGTSYGRSNKVVLAVVEVEDIMWRSDLSFLIEVD
ncbi:unnamed protein product [Lactuca saligna]|uniref:Uncharacterized protein n=1 Tax=Lactuca saligna TaxID=75948 RepID=A0AA35YFK7_LACSI|nr:unnamed protein product [Lactuca saligna]